MASIFEKDGQVDPTLLPVTGYYSGSQPDPPNDPKEHFDLVAFLVRLDERLDRIEEAIGEGQGPTFTKEWFTVSEAAEILGKAPFTVREWARLDRINASKRHCGRGRASEWMIAHSEIERIQNKGLLPQGL